jgi:hypothetical protein
MPGSDTGAVPKLGRKAPSLKKNTHSSTGSNTGRNDPGGSEVSTVKQANVMEQGTGRRAVRQEIGSTVDNSR